MKHLMVFLLFVIALLPASSRAQSFSLALSPLEGPPGSQVTLSGRGAPPQASIQIYYQGWDGGLCDIPTHREMYSLRVGADRAGQFSIKTTAEKRSDTQVGMMYGAYTDERGWSNSVCFRFQITNSRTFPETGQTVTGRFYQFWEENGGLATYGFPITAAADEVNPDTQQTYLTQWFERNRFELHPENRAPYDVLLGRLGADRLAQLGRDWRNEGRERGPKQGCIWFEETGHNVCNQAPGLVCFGGFADYWSCFGPSLSGGDRYAASLALFGLPLTEAKMETNSSGDTVLTQWFERARFEWHPNEHGNGDVLLGLLGREVKGLP